MNAIASVEFEMPAHWSDEQRARLAEMRAAGAVIAYWCSDAWGRPSNGGKGEPAAPGTVHEERGPLQLCGAGTLHATREPHRWRGVRVWAVAMLGEVQKREDKLGALRRVVLGEFRPVDKCAPSVGIRIGAAMSYGGANLAGAYLWGADLARANLARANLGGANLEGANLSGANLAGANLALAYLECTNLECADLAGANLAGAYLWGADLAGANLERANLAGAYLAGAYLAGANLAGAYLAGANLECADLAGANLSGADLGGAYRGASSAPVGWRVTVCGYLERDAQ